MQSPKNLVLTKRDIIILMQLYLHRVAFAGQLAKLCFGDVSYDTARKRLRKLQQAKYISCDKYNTVENKGRPELIYFLTSSGANALEHYSKIHLNVIPTGAPHVYHREYLLQLVDIHLSLEKARRKNYITDLQWNTEKEYQRGFVDDKKTLGLANASVTFRYLESQEKTSSIIQIDTGNLRQTRHWEPKMKLFLKTNCFIWIITNNIKRMSILQTWTKYLLEETGFNSKRCMFAIYHEIMTKGIFGAAWYNLDGSSVQLLPVKR